MATGFTVIFTDCDCCATLCACCAAKFQPDPGLPPVYPATLSLSWDCSDNIIDGDLLGQFPLLLEFEADPPTLENCGARYVVNPVVVYPNLCYYNSVITDGCAGLGPQGGCLFIQLSCFPFNLSGPNGWTLLVRAEDCHCGLYASHAVMPSLEICLPDEPFHLEFDNFLGHWEVDE